MKWIMVLIGLLPLLSAQSPGDLDPGANGGCTSIGRRCIREARCEQVANNETGEEEGQCVCPDGTHGDGIMECVNDNELLCRCDRDPKVTTWDGATADVSLPCWYRLTTVEVPSGHSHPGSPPNRLRLIVNAMNRMRQDGLFYVYEVRIALELRFGSGVPVVPTVFSISAGDIWNAKGKNPWHYKVREAFAGQALHFTWDPLDKFAIMEIPDSGMRIKYRAYDPQAFPQVLSPGVTIMVPHTVTFLSEPEHRGVCLVPGEGSYALRTRANESGIHFPNLYTLYNALQTDVLDIESDPVCLSVRSLLFDSHDRAKLAVKICGPILTHPETASCLMSRGEEPMMMFENCVRWITKEDKQACRHVRENLFHRDQENNVCPATRELELVLCDKHRLHLLDMTIV